MKDAVGNELHVGDLVAIQLERPLIYGRVTEMAQGGIVTGLKKGGEDMTPSRIVVTSQHPMLADPRIDICGAVMALRDPNAPEVIETFADQAEAKPN